MVSFAVSLTTWAISAGCAPCSSAFDAAIVVVTSFAFSTLVGVGLTAASTIACFASAFCSSSACTAFASAGVLAGAGAPPNHVGNQLAVVDLSCFQNPAAGFPLTQQDFLKNNQLKCKKYHTLYYCFDLTDYKHPATYVYLYSYYVFINYFSSFIPIVYSANFIKNMIIINLFDSVIYLLTNFKMIEGFLNYLLL